MPSTTTDKRKKKVKKASGSGSTDPTPVSTSPPKKSTSTGAKKPKKKSRDTDLTDVSPLSVVAHESSAVSGGGSSGTTVESSAPTKVWTYADKWKLIVKIDKHLDAAHRQNNLTYKNIFSGTLNLYDNKSMFKKFKAVNHTVFAEELKKFKKFRKKKPDCTGIEMLEWWLTNPNETERRDLFIEWADDPQASVGENVHFTLGLKALKGDKSEVEQGELLPKCYLVKFMVLADNLFYTSHHPYNMMDPERRPLIEVDYPQALEVVGGKDRKKFETEVGRVLADFPHDVLALTPPKTWVGLIAKRIMGTESKKASKKKSPK